MISNNTSKMARPPPKNKLKNTNRLIRTRNFRDFLGNPLKKESFGLTSINTKDQNQSENLVFKTNEMYSQSDILQAEMNLLKLLNSNQKNNKINHKKKSKIMQKIKIEKIEIKRNQLTEQKLNHKQFINMKSKRKIGIFERNMDNNQTNINSNDNKNNEKKYKNYINNKDQLKNKNCSKKIKDLKLTDKKIFKLNNEINKDSKNDLNDLSTNKKTKIPNIFKKSSSIITENFDNKLKYLKPKPKILFTQKSKQNGSSNIIPNCIVSLNNSNGSTISYSSLQNKIESLTAVTKNTLTNEKSEFKLEEELPNRKYRKIKLNKIGKSFLVFEGNFYFFN